MLAVCVSNSTAIGGEANVNKVQKSNKRVSYAKSTALADAATWAQVVSFHSFFTEEPRMLAC